MSTSDGSGPEIVVIGSVIIGLCSCYYLLESPVLPHGSRITLVENSRSHQIAYGASSNAGGLLAGGNADSDWFGPTTSSLAELSLRCHRELAESGIGAWGYRETVATGLRVGKGEQSRSAYRSLPAGTTNSGSNRDQPLDWLNGDREDLGTEGGVGQIDPREFCNALYAHMYTKSNFRVIFGDASSFKPSKLEVKGELHLKSGDSNVVLPVSKLIICAGPWSSIVCSTLGLPALKLTNLPGHSLLIRPSPGPSLRAEAVFAGINGAEGGVHAATSGLARDLTREELQQGFTKAPELFTRTSGVVYVAGENAVPVVATGHVDDQSGPNRLPENVDDVHKLKDENLIGRLRTAATLVSGRLNEEKGAVIEREQFCYRPVSFDGEPQIGSLTDGVFVATGHGPWGISLAPGTGLVMSEIVLNSKSLSADISQLSPHRFDDHRTE